MLKSSFVSVVIVLSFCAAAFAAVPNRITYQGRLMKSGLTAAGKHDFQVCFVPATNGCVTFLQVPVPASGDFTLIVNVPATVDFSTNTYTLQLSVDNQPLSPNDDFTAVPYALVAAKAMSVDAGGVHLSNTTPLQNLSSWQSSSDATLINPAKVDWSQPGQWVKGTNGTISYGGGNVGISTSTPADPLSVGGSIYFAGDLESNGGFTIRDKAANAARVTVAGTGAVTINNGLSMNNTNISGLATATNADQAVRYDQLSSFFVMPAGVLLAYAGTTIPPGFLLCDGKPHPRTGTYAALFAAIGTTWGAGDGSTTFNVPDFTRRTAVGAGGTGSAVLGNAVGNVGGEEVHTILLTEMPSHQHSYQGYVHAHDNFGGGSNNVALWGGSVLTSPVGGDANGNTVPHNNIQPSAVVNYIIKY